MKVREGLTVDNRSASDMHEWHEARIEALKARIAELEKENEALRRALKPRADSTNLIINNEALRKAANDGR